MGFSRLPIPRLHPAATRKICKGYILIVQMMRVLVAPDPESLAEVASQEIRSVLSKQKRPANLGLSGGNTPGPTYQRLFASDFDWEITDLWLADERWVGWNHPRNNGRMIAGYFPPEVEPRFHRPPHSHMFSPRNVIDRYQEILDKLFAAGPPQVILLGMGEDGHTASLFPGSDGLTETESCYLAHQIPETGEWRLSASFPLLLSAGHLFVLVTGPYKAGVLAEVLEGKTDTYPAGRLLETKGDLTWLLDEAAASQLTSTPVEKR